MTITADAPTTLDADMAVLDEPFVLDVPGLPGDGSPVILHVDEARGLTYTWQDQSTRKQDYGSRRRGFLVSRLSVTHTSGHEVAYLSVTSTTKELVASLFTSSFEWADENTSASFGYWRREVTPAEQWAAAYTHLPLRPPSMDGKGGWGSYSASEAPTNPVVLATELAVAEQVFTKQMRGFVRWLSVPFVDYSHVDGETLFTPHPEDHPGALRGTGVGRMMYLLAAQHLSATRGTILRASGVQSDEAQALWQRLVADPTVPTRMSQSTFYKPAENRTKRYLCVDYTDTIPRTKDIA